MLEHITDSQTGEVTIRELTAQEIADRTPDPAVILTKWRATAQCTRMQGILALGETRWNSVLSYRATATWAEKIVIDDASDWNRTSQNIAFFGYLLGLTDVEIDTLFTVAAEIVA